MRVNADASDLGKGLPDQFPDHEAFSFALLRRRVHIAPLHAGATLRVFSLFGWARTATVRAEHTAIAGLGTQARAAMRAVVEK